MSPSSPLLADLADIGGPAAAEAPLARLGAGEVLVELCNDRIEARVTILDAILAQLAESETKLVWIGNPLRSPLTVERFFLQAVGPDLDLRLEPTAAELAAMLQSAAHGSPRCLFIVQQPETLDAEARDTIARIAPLLAGQSPACQFLFCGTQAFRPITPVQADRRLVALRLIDPGFDLEPRISRGEKLPLLLLLLVAAAGTLLPGALPNAPPSTLPAPVQAAAAASADGPAGTRSAQPQPAAPPSTAPEPDNAPRTDVSGMRREFDAFLAQQPPRLSALTQEQRDALFQEFLQHRRQRTSASPL